MFHFCYIISYITVNYEFLHPQKGIYIFAIDS